MRTETLEILAEAIALSYPWEVLLDVRGMMFELRMRLGFTAKDSFQVFFKALEVKQMMGIERHPGEPPEWVQ